MILQRLNSRAWLVSLAFLFVAGGVFAKPPPPSHWEKDIEAFEASDATNPPPQKANLFIGSSSIRIWQTMAQDFPGRKVINRGFGGSAIADSTYYFDRIVTPYKPKQIFLFGGSNDIDQGKTPEEVLADFQAFVEKAHQVLPRTTVIFISISTSPRRFHEIGTVQKANELISAFIAQNKKLKLKFIDVFHLVIDADGKPKPELYRADNLHMNASGYALWIPFIKPYLK